MQAAVRSGWAVSWFEKLRVIPSRSPLLEQQSETSSQNLAKGEGYEIWSRLGRVSIHIYFFSFFT